MHQNYKKLTDSTSKGAGYIYLKSFDVHVFHTTKIKHATLKVYGNENDGVFMHHNNRHQNNAHFV